MQGRPGKAVSPCPCLTIYRIMQAKLTYAPWYKLTITRFTSNGSNHEDAGIFYLLEKHTVEEVCFLLASSSPLIQH